MSVRRRPPSPRAGGGWSIASRRSLASIASVDSAFSIGSVGSFASIASIGSSMSIASIGSHQSRGSVLSHQSDASVLSAQSQGSLLSYRSRGGVRDRETVGEHRALPRGAAVAIGVLAGSICAVVLGRGRVRAPRSAISPSA